MTHYNKLLPAEAERLALLIEECGEVVQAAADACLHGYEGDLRTAIEKELGDVKLVIAMMEAAGDFDDVVLLGADDCDPERQKPYPQPLPPHRKNLSHLIKDCGQVLQAVGKIQRHGYHGTHPSGGPDNRELLVQALNMLRISVASLCEDGELSAEVIIARVAFKKQKIVRYLHHQSPELLAAA